MHNLWSRGPPVAPSRTWPAIFWCFSHQTRPGRILLDVEPDLLKLFLTPH